MDLMHSTGFIRVSAMYGTSMLMHTELGRNREKKPEEERLICMRNYIIILFHQPPPSLLLLPVDDEKNSVYQTQSLTHPRMNQQGGNGNDPADAGEQDIPEEAAKLQATL